VCVSLFLSLGVCVCVCLPLERLIDSDAILRLWLERRELRHPDGQRTPWCVCVCVPLLFRSSHCLHFLLLVSLSLSLSPLSAFSEILIDGDLSTDLHYTGFQEEIIPGSLLARARLLTCSAELLLHGAQAAARKLVYSAPCGCGPVMFFHLGRASELRALALLRNKISLQESRLSRAKLRLSSGSDLVGQPLGQDARFAEGAASHVIHAEHALLLAALDDLESLEFTVWSLGSFNS